MIHFIIELCIVYLYLHVVYLLIIINNKIKNQMKQFELLDGKVTELGDNVAKVVDFITNPQEGPLTDTQAQGFADKLDAANSALKAVLPAPTGPVA